MRLVFYDDRDLPAALTGPPSVFLAGPTRRGPGRTPWREQAIHLFEHEEFEGILVIPEFKERTFDEAAPLLFADPPSPVTGMRAVSHNILSWETCGIEQATRVLFWMPFSIAGEDPPLPGFTTRSEVAREIARAPARLILGMPREALSGSHIRYHANRAGLPVYAALEETVRATVASLRA